MTHKQLEEAVTNGGGKLLRQRNGLLYVEAGHWRGWIGIPLKRVGREAISDYQRCRAITEVVRAAGASLPK